MAISKFILFLLYKVTERWMRFAKGSLCCETTLQKPVFWAEVALPYSCQSLRAQRGFLCLMSPDDPIACTASHAGLGWRVLRDHPTPIPQDQVALRPIHT